MSTRSTPNENEASEPGKIRRKQLIVLIIDDDDMYRTSLRLKLERDYGASVTETDNATTAIVMMMERRFDLILLDQWLPETTGAEAYPQMRQSDACGQVVFMSTDANVREIADNFGLAFFSKLDDVETLERILLDCDDGSAQ